MPAPLALGTRSEGGFVLPTVLAYIAAFTFIVLTAALILDRSRDLAMGLDLQARLDGELSDAESEVVFYFLTSRPVPGQLELLPATISAEDVLLGNAPSVDPASPSTSTYWNARGGIVLLADEPVMVWAVYQDISGLISLNSSRPELVEALLASFGVSKSEVAGLAARLADYQDSDQRRRPQGAERADYRLRQLPSPTDSPLRNLAELGHVMGWDALAFTQSLEFLSATTAAPTSIEPNRAFAPQVVLSLMSDLSPLFDTDVDPLTLALGASQIPGDRARFGLIAQDLATGDLRVRLIEVQRQPSAASVPFTRSLIADMSNPRLPESWIPNENVTRLVPLEPESR